ncbi:immunoglobulin-like domain-containing protein [Listeria booriae]|uniref:DUF5011 domain-containing protein n=1 Tax=Listeria booriae TaxID=1552123 RepID=A0A7X0XNS9_9LIST|nr:immunoglobulin-like domain-containing protein [Listeria booriae]MBC1777945.1 DUF5011 domain-containing protein [Listeria booriae]
MKKPKNKVFKKVAVGLLATNIIASGVVANVPFNVLAAESTPNVTTQALGATSGVVVRSNMLLNPQFDGFYGWTPYVTGHDMSSVGTFSATADETGYFHVLGTRYGDDAMRAYPTGNGAIRVIARSENNDTNYPTASITQIIKTEPGKRYELQYKATDLGYGQYSAGITEDNIYGKQLAGSGFMLKPDGQMHTLRFTATTANTSIKFITLHQEDNTLALFSGKVEYSNLKLIDITTLTQTTVNAVNDNSTTVSGIGEPGGTITIKNKSNGQTIATGTIGADGTYSFPMVKQPVNSVLEATVSAYDKTSTGTATVVASPIAATTIGALNNMSTVVSGNAEPNSSMVITNKAGVTIASGIVGSDGKYTFSIAPQAAGDVITAKATSNGQTASASTTVTAVSNEKPVITAANKALKVGDAFNPLTGVTATDTEDGSLTSKIKVTANNVDTNKAGTYAVTYSVTDSNNNTTTKTITVTVTEVANTLTANDFAVGLDNYVKGTYTGNVAKLGLEVNGTLLQVINATGTPYQYYAKGKILSNTDQVYVISYDATNKQLQKVKVNITQQTAGTVSPAQFYIGKDNYVTGSLTGDVKKLSLTINGVEGQQINVAAPNFKYYANNLIRNTTDNVIVKGYDAAGKLLDSKTVIVSKDQGQAGTITSADTFKIGKDSYVTGAYTGDVSKVELQVNGATLQRINVTGGTIKYYAKNNITKATDVVKLVGYNSSGVVVSTKTVPVAATTGDITANPYVIGTDSYVKGQFSGDVAKISLTVNGVKQTTINAPAGPDYQYYAKSLIQNATDNVVITAYDSLGGVLKTVQVPVSKKAPTGTVTANTVIVGDSYLTGTATGEVKKVTISVNGVTQTSPAFVQADGTYKYYIKSLNLKPTDTVKVIGLDGLSNQLATGNVTVTQ